MDNDHRLEYMIFHNFSQCPRSVLGLQTKKKKRFILLANIHDDVERVLRKRAFGAVLLFAVVSVESRFAGEINHFADVQRQFAVVGRLEGLFGEAVRTSSDALLHVFKESRAAGDFPARFWGYGSLVFRLGCTGKKVK